MPDWNNTQAGTIFEQIFTAQQGDFVAVAAANDGLGGAVVSVLERNGLSRHRSRSAVRTPRTRACSGSSSARQCNTVYKAVRRRRMRLPSWRIALAKGDTAAADALATGTVEDTETGEDVKSVLLEPQGITKENVKDVIADGYTTEEKVCTTPELQAACTAAGIS